MERTIVKTPVITEQQGNLLVSEWKQEEGSEAVQLQLLRKDDSDEVHMTMRYIGDSMDATVSITLSREGRQELIEELSRGLEAS